jgi:hypothetical protein
VSEFVEECRREWRRLHVPDLVANEMAADLAADLRDAEVEGASREDLLGDAALDAHAFARSWAQERGLVTPAASQRRRLRLALSLVVAAIIIGGGTAAGLLFTRAPSQAQMPQVVVPHVVGVNIAKATAAAESAGLIPEIRYRTRRRGRFGFVAFQTPSPDTKVQQGTALFLVVNR